MRRADGAALAVRRERLVSRSLLTLEPPLVVAPWAPQQEARVVYRERDHSGYLVTAATEMPLLSGIASLLAAVVMPAHPALPYDAGNCSALAPRMSALPPRFLGEVCSVAQRTVLGFPAPGDRYWDADTLDAVGQRYSGMDMRPYYRAAGLAPPAAASRARL